MAYTRNDYIGTPGNSTTLNGSITNVATSITITSATGWPSVTNTGFYAVIDPDVVGSEEKVFVTGRTGTSLTVTRGVDGTTGVSHASGATIRPTFSGVDADEANYMVAQTVGKVTTAGQMLKASAANTFTTLDKGSNSTILAVDSGGTLGYTTAATDMFAANAVTNAKLAGMTRGTVKVGDASGAASDLAIGSSGKYLKSDGTDVSWASMPIDGWTIVRKTADQSMTDVGWTTDSELQFATANGSVYEFEAYLLYIRTSGGSSADLVVRAEGLSSFSAFYGSSAKRWTYIDAYTTNYVVSFADLETADADDTLVRSLLLRGTFVATDTGGFGIKAVPAALGAITVKAGSYLRYRSVS